MGASWWCSIYDCYHVISNPIREKLVILQYDKTPAQILIRWSLQHGLVIIPKSIHVNRIKENSQVFDFEIKEEDMKMFSSLNADLHTVV